MPCLDRHRALLFQSYSFDDCNITFQVSDLLVVLVNMPMQLHYYVQNEWTAGQIPCKLANYVQGVTIVVSILTLTAVAIDRSEFIPYSMTYNNKC